MKTLKITSLLIVTFSVISVASYFISANYFWMCTH